MESGVKHRGPESAQWDRLKGQSVLISLLARPGLSDALAGRLVWVDRYSIGVELEIHQGEISIIHRGPGLIITPA